MVTRMLKDYIGKGPLADRPTDLELTEGAMAIYYSTDTGELSIWEGEEWVEFQGGGSGGSKRNTDFHGYIGRTTLVTPTEGEFNPISLGIDILASDNWREGDGLIVPAGVEFIRVAITTQVWGVTSDDGRIKAGWGINETALYALTDTSPEQKCFVTTNLGVMPVTEGQPIVLSVLPMNPCSFAYALIDIEVIQGSILGSVPN